ncbi:response regulator transcription factor [Enemella evansiae]|uniref:response regulator transcription factor n=1 Tax=Enemella evansiae TaxID=2016499 RepID=UPI000B95D394|nr:response regulator transcription factor [Enemella evansiae]OYO15074.1 DNA-binding response regulator [Enemella evansiae]TDO92613.1 DNA-binding response OmpR family regulator [Enemella evansiae]
MSSILIVEDEAEIASFIARGLGAAGHQTETVGAGQAAIERVSAGEVDLMVLDVGLPDIDGFEVVRRLRESGSRVPVIILTARTSVTDTVAGLESGADDYMAKPFSVDELVARVRLRLRPADTEPLVLSHGDLSLDVRTRRARAGEHEVELTAREFALAEAFLRHPGEVLTREQLLSMVWGLDSDPGSNVLEVYVRYLRRKIGAQYFQTVRGRGYRLA